MNYGIDYNPTAEEVALANGWYDLHEEVEFVEPEMVVDDSHLAYYDDVDFY